MIIREGDPKKVIEGLFNKFMEHMNEYKKAFATLKEILTKFGGIKPEDVDLSILGNPMISAYISKVSKIEDPEAIKEINGLLEQWNISQLLVSDYSTISKRWYQSYKL